MTYLKWLLILAVVTYGGLLALLYVFQRALMYFPDLTRVAPAQAGLPRAEEVALTSSDGEKLVAWYVAPRGDRPMVVYFQGMPKGCRPASTASPGSPPMAPACWRCATAAMAVRPERRPSRG